MNADEAKAFRALADAATEGPWGDIDGQVISRPDDYPGRESRVVFTSAWSRNRAFAAAARNNAERLCDAALYALELERIVHDIQRGEAADLVAEARRLGREDVLAAAKEQGAISGYDLAGVLARLPPLPDEPATNRDLRERCGRLEAENAELRAGLEKIADPASYSIVAARSIARALLEIVP